MKAIINANLVLNDRILEDGAMLVCGDRILVIGKKDQVVIPSGTEIIDAEGLYAGPGFVDIHCHAGGNVWAYEDPMRMADFHLAGGSTSLNCTLYQNLNKDEILQAMKNIRKAMEDGKPGNIVGIHLEGPFLNPKYGALSKTIRPVNKKEYRRYLAEASDILRMWTIAPEIEGATEFIKEVHAACVPVAIGHSEASPEVVFQAIENGVTICTHLMDATGCSISPTRWEGTKECCFDEAVMLCDNIYCEIINDSKGVHVRPELIRLIIKTIGIDYVVGITDACADSLDSSDHNNKSDNSSSNSNSGNSNNNGDDINMVNGELTGSKMRMYQVARNFKNNAYLDMVDVFRVCSENPAKAIKISNEVGTLHIGKKANIIIVDKDYNISKVMLNGILVIDKMNERIDR